MMFFYCISLLFFLKLGFISDVYGEVDKQDAELLLKASKQHQDQKGEYSIIPIKTEQEINHFIQEIERYMNGLKILSCSFKQTNITNHPKKETYQSGKIVMDKQNPKHYKIQIDFPAFKQQILLIDDNLAIFDLKEGKIISKANLSSTPISYIFSNKLDIKKQFKSISLWKIPSQEMIFIKLREKENQASNIMLYFKLYKNHNIYYLMGWTLCDPHKNLTGVNLDLNSLIVNDPKVLASKGLFQVKKNKSSVSE